MPCMGQHTRRHSPCWETDSASDSTEHIVRRKALEDTLRSVGTESTGRERGEGGRRGREAREGG
eukprot:1322055-Rhodomonas_salina.1